MRYLPPVALFVVLLLNCFSISGQTKPGDFANIFHITQEAKEPVRIAVDHSDHIFVTDASQGCIIQYDGLNNFVGKLYICPSPVSIAISDNNIMFVGDGQTGKIYKRLANGITQVIYSDTIFPDAMAVSPDNKLYVTDSRGNRVLVMDFAGTLLNTIGSGVFYYPTGIAFDRKNNRIVVGEHGGLGSGFNLNAKIRIYGVNGNLISSFGGYGSTPGKLYRIQGLSIGRCGNIYVTEPFQGNVDVFNENGVYITKFGVWGDSLGQMNVPLDIAFNSQERLFVASMNNSAIEVFSISDSLPSSTITSGSASICAGSTTPVVFSFTGTAPWTFTYTINGTNPQTITNTHSNPYVLNTGTPGSYNVTALSDSLHNGTCFSNTGTVILNPLPASAIANNTYYICAGDTVSIPVTFTGASPWTFTYAINGINTDTVVDLYTNTFEIPAYQPGVYTITSLNGNGCNGNSFPGAATVVMNPSPTSAILPGNSMFCSGSVATVAIALAGTAPWDLTYSVNGANHTTVTNILASPYNLNVTTPGTYEVVALHDANCTGTTFSGSAAIFEHLLPEATISNLITSICQGDSAIIPIDLSGTPPWTLTYTIDGQNPTVVSNILSSPYIIHTSTGGVYEVTALSDSLCSGTNFVGSCTVTVNPLPNVNLGPDVEICNGQTATLYGGSFASYFWSNFSTDSSITVGTAGNYSLTAVDLNGCVNSDTVNVSVRSAPVSSFTFSPNILEVTFNNSSTDADSFNWDFGDGTTSAEVNPVHNYPGPGSYLVTLNAISPCGTSVMNDSVSLVFSGLEPTPVMLTLNIYPNPSSGLFTIEVNNSENATLELKITNPLGQLVFQEEINGKKIVRQFNMSLNASGIYLIRLISNDTAFSHKLILNH